MQEIIAGRRGVDKSAVHSLVIEQVDCLFDLEPSSPFEAEKAVWSCMLAIGRLLLEVLLARMCRQATVDELASRGYSLNDVQLRLDANYRAKLTTTLGKVIVPLFAYRFRNKAGSMTTRCPARSLFPWYPRCRSSRLMLRWETTLGSRLPFREVQNMLRQFTHGAVNMHDTTVAAHCAVVAAVVDRSLLYLSPKRIRHILRERAVRDSETGLPIVHFSTDGHAERLLEGDTWQRSWKMLNGIRLWCIDKVTGRSIPLGGEFIVGDCHCVAAAFDELDKIGVLPFDGNYGYRVNAQLVFIADGMEWFDTHVVNKFTNAVAIVDAYHVLERVGKLFAEIWGSGSKKAKHKYGAFCRWVTGRNKPKGSKPKVRKGHKKGKKQSPYAKERKFPAIDEAALADVELPKTSGGGLVAALLELLGDTIDERINKVLDYLGKRLDRLCYPEFWHRGFHISSAAMESFNRIAQQRIKLPGATWTPDMAQAILNLRMMNVIGNDEHFWNDDDAMHKLGQHWQARNAS